MPPKDMLATLGSAPHALGDFLHSLPDDHPLQIALRTYALSLSLALGPALLPFAISSKARRGGLEKIWKVLRREFGVTGFACAMTVGVGGGAAIRQLLEVLGETNVRSDAGEKKHIQLALLKDLHKTFFANVLSSSLAIALFHLRKQGTRRATGRAPIPLTSPAPNNDAASSTISSNARPSITLDLTLLLLVRAMDSLAQMVISKICALIREKTETQDEEAVQKRKRSLRTKLDALVFWACSARIMWCFFYEPERLPRSYNKWHDYDIANIDHRLLDALRAIRAGTWSYRQHQSTRPDLISSIARDIGYPEKWGDLKTLPAYGGAEATAAWKLLGVSSRGGVGGIPCELVHGKVAGASCTANVAIRGAEAFAEAFALYLPVHFLPILLTRPRTLLHARRLLRTFLAVLRSASFLSSFVSSIWLAVCLTRTLFLARLFPWISHDIWDGPFGCTFAGSLVCGGSIWIEQGRRRGEIALYALPRAIRACLSEGWVRGGSRSIRYLERITFVLSLSSILTAAIHRPDSLRGLSRWTVAFVLKGPNAGFWKRKRGEDISPSTPTGDSASQHTLPPST